MFNAGLKNIVEAIIFASQEEITAKQIKEILDSFKIESKAAEIEEIISALNIEYANGDSAFEIIKIAGGYQFATRKKFSHFVGKLYTETQRKKLSPSAIETLAIIAYKQPITRSDIEFIRGVNVDYIVNSLLERDLITIKGRASGPGRPILYGTTSNFLKVLGLNALEDLPKLREINEILKNEKIDGITEADIDLFNSVNTESNLFSAGTVNPQGTSLYETEELDKEKDIKEETTDENIAEEVTEEESAGNPENTGIINPEEEINPEEQKEEDKA
ncbi:MAG: SMC-Scp complex subunit ScpB [Ignavibacteriae bacterium]|nr:SMC-Scp complex subunit ScpB [Ignavibacteriota bacterium]